MTDVSGAPASGRRRLVGLWWAGPTVIALVGGSAVSLALVPGVGQGVGVPAQVVVAAGSRTTAPVVAPTTPAHSRHNARHHRRGGGSRPTPVPAPVATAPSPSTQPIVVTPSRRVESEPPDDRGYPSEKGDDRGTHA